MLRQIQCDRETIKILKYTAGSMLFPLLYCIFANGSPLKKWHEWYKSPLKKWKDMLKSRLKKWKDA